MKNNVLLIGFTVVLPLLYGCGHSPEETSEMSRDAERSLEVVRGSALKSLLESSKHPVLVEFGVDYNCPRCQEVKSDVIDLKERLRDQVQVVRVDYNTNMAMVSQLGGTICPTYVLFQNGQPVLTRSFPVSMDLLEGAIAQLGGNR